MAANIELLKDAYQIIDGIPESAFSLSQVITKRGHELQCGTIACAIGWLSLHPDMAKALNVELINEWRVRWNVGDEWTTGDYAVAGAKAFGITKQKAEALFGPREWLTQTRAEAHLSDKQLWLKRARKLIARLQDSARAKTPA